MRRGDKAAHQDQLDMARNSVRGVPPAGKFQSPKEIAKRGGRVQMTTSEYVDFRMGRGHRDEGQARENWAEERRGRRRIEKK